MSRAIEAFAVLGDVVRSRDHADQLELLGRLETELDWVNAQLPVEAILQPFGVTIGDEFQGAFGNLETALRAVLLVQLRLASTVRTRFGIGHGEIQFAETIEQPLGQSGNAWWSARHSIDSVKRLEDGREAYRSCAFESIDPRLGGAVQAFLVLRDRVFADLDERDMAIALGITLGEPQKQIAERLGIDPAAVTRRKYTSWIVALLAAHAALEESR